MHYVFVLASAVEVGQHQGCHEEEQYSHDKQQDLHSQLLCLITDWQDFLHEASLTLEQHDLTALADARYAGFGHVFVDAAYLALLPLSIVSIDTCLISD